ncbi:pap 25a associated domain family [Phlyctema vagabunda]|uniref:polynucleotide adenylyltransferase n=1 Tax=Phlyctema vagabunda TaxID=108571 RepID=A0ABR4P6C9_9HELO
MRTVDICITTQWKQLEGVCMIAALLARSGMEKVICVSTAKVPIVKIWDPELRLACDMNVNNTAALENTRMIKTYVQIDSRVRPLAMIIKHWTKQRILNDAAFGGTLSSYTWICMIINFLQTRDPPVVPSLHQRKHQILPSKNGTESQFADDLDSLKEFGKKNKNTLGELLFQFFRFYSHEFDYDNQVVSVRNGSHITKIEKGWHVGIANTNLCVEEPFNQVRNLGNTADDTSFRGLHIEMRRAFGFIAEAKLEECCEQFEFPEVEEKPIFERRKPQPTPVISRSASSSTRGNRGNRGRNQHRTSNSSRRSSSGAFDHNLSYTSHGPASAEQEQWLQRQAQVQLHNELFTKYTVLQQEEIRLRQYQAFQQQQAAQQAYVQAQHQKAQARGAKQQAGDRSRTSSFDQAPLSAPLRQEMYFYPLQYQPSPVYTYQGPSTNPPSPSMGNAIPELRRSVHRSSITNGSGSATSQSSSTLRSHSQPASRTAQSPLSVHGAPIPEQGLHGLGLLQTMQYSNGQLVPNFIADEALDQNLEGSLSRSGMRMRPDDSAAKEYVGYYVNNSPANVPRRQTQASLAIPAFGDLGQNRRRLSTDQFPQSILDRLRRTSRSPSPLGDGRRDRSSSVDAPPISQNTISSTNIRALNNQGPLVANGSNIPMPSVASGWTATRSDRSVSEDHNSEIAIGSYGSASQNSDVGSEPPADLIPSGQTTPKIPWNSDRLEQPVVVNGSVPISSVENGYHSSGPSTSNNAASLLESAYVNGFTAVEPSNGVHRLSANSQRTGRQLNNSSISPVDIHFNPIDNQPHLSPVYETRTPSPTANRKLEGVFERTSNGKSAKDVKLEQVNLPTRLVPTNGSQLKPFPTSETKSNGHVRASRSEGGGPGAWQKASKQKKKGQSSEHKNVPNGQSLSEKLPRNESERKGG